MSEWSKMKAVRRDRGIGGPGGPHPRTEKPKNAGKTVLRLIRTMSGNKGALAFAFVLILLSALAGITGTYLLKPMINSLTKSGNLTVFAAGLVKMAVIYGVGALSTYGSSRIMVGVAQKTTNRIRSSLFNHMQDLPLHYFDSRTHGELMSRFTNDVDNVNMALEQSLSQAVTSLVSVVGTFIMMLVLSPILTIFIVLMLIVMLRVVKVVGSKSSQYFRGQQKALGELNGYIEEMIEGQKVVKVFNHEAKTVDEFRRRNDALRLASTDAQTFAGIIMPIMGNLSYINYAVTAVVGSILSIRGFMDIGTIAAFLQYTRSFSQPITQIANQLNMLLAALAGAERIFEVMDEIPETDGGEVSLVLAEKGADGALKEVSGNACSFGSYGEQGNGARIPAWKTTNGGKPGLVPLEGDVRFHDVVFGYLPETTVLHSISLYAKPSQRIAFVGSTGAGKTTITNLINRFYDIQSGAVTYDGIDIRDIQKKDLRRTLGIVLQDVHLFQGTIRDNIRYGKLDANEEEIVQAAKIANAHSFIVRLKDGYDTVLAPDGANLSQGQRQLLSIARAAVANPPVLILDEATSSIDTRTERLIEQGMNRLMRSRTTFIIAHRLSTVRTSNAILVLEGGNIIERGDHESLLQEKGRYYQLYTGAAELS